jgi:hypothetical protein
MMASGLMMSPFAKVERSYDEGRNWRYEKESAAVLKTTELQEEATAFRVK